MKLAEMNGFPGLLQSTLAIPEDENMFLRSGSSNVESVFMNWEKEGNCFEEGKKLQLVSERYPAVKNSIDNALILTGVGINAFIKSVSKYLDLMIHLPLCADLALAEVLNLVDYYIYGVTTLFAPRGPAEHALRRHRRQRDLPLHRPLHPPVPAGALPEALHRGGRAEPGEREESHREAHAVVARRRGGRARGSGGRETLS